MLIRIAIGTAAPALASFAAFARDNAGLQDFGEPSVGAIYERLLAGETVRLGGGAAPLVEIEALGQAGAEP